MTTRPTHWTVLVMGGAFLWLQILWLLAGGLYAWILRDGLGPEATTSTGIAALSRMFWVFNWGPTCVALLIIDVLWCRHRKRNTAR